MHSFNFEMKHKPIISWILLFGIIMITSLTGSKISFSSTIEEKIRSGLISTADSIIPDHPRIWLKGNWDWDYNNYGSFAWRICHGEPINKDDPACDQEKQEFYYTVCSSGDYSADYMINEGQTGHTTHGRRVLEHIWAGISQKYNWWDFLPNQIIGVSGTFDPNYTRDQYFAYAREKLLGILQPNEYWMRAYTVIYGSVAYDWLYNETYEDGTPVLSQSDKTAIQNSLISLADYMKNLTDGSDELFQSADISKYFYPMVGMALYEPSGQGISTQNNLKAKEYLDDFDTYWIGKILPALNEQGGDGGWHGGIGNVGDVICWFGTPTDWVLPVLMVPLLFAHYTATGQSFEESLFSTSILKHHAEFHNYMIRPSPQGYSGGEYYEIGNLAPNRSPWVFQMRTYARRRFSNDPEQQRIAELGNWVARRFHTQFTYGGSWCMVDQTMFEDKWVNPRSPEELGYGTKHFEKLGWVFLREGFTSADDLAGLFICQRYHWSHLDPYSQNSFTLERKSELIEGFHNTVYIDDGYQREISSFPTITDGIEAYSPGSSYDIGPGILDFQSNDFYDYVKGDATNAYDPSKLDVFTRELVFLRPNIFVMFDKVVTDNTGTKKSWVIDPASSPIDEGNNVYIIENGAGMLWIKNLSPQSTTVESITASQFKINTFGTRESFFLQAMEATDSGVSSSTVSVDNAELVVNADRIGVNIGEWEILFNKNGASGVWVKGPETPVELCLFEAIMINDGVQLRWQTASETNNFGFEIERSLNKKKFQKIGFVRKHETVTSHQNYQFFDNTVEAGNYYYYRLKQIDLDGTFDYSSFVEVNVAVPKQLNLYQNYPNPFNPSTEICYSLPCNTSVKLSIFDVLGRSIITLVQERQSAGNKTVKWDGKDKAGSKVASGLYIYQLQTERSTLSRKMLFLH